METVLRFVFDWFDTDHDGTIDREEMKILHNALKMSIPEKAFDFPLPWHTTIEFEKFVRLLTPIFESVHALVSTFRSFDLNQNGLLSREELKGIFVEFGIDVDDGEIAEIIRQTDQDNDGQINFKEFVDAGSCCFLSLNALRTSDDIMGSDSVQIASPEKKEKVEEWSEFNQEVNGRNGVSIRLTNKSGQIMDGVQGNNQLEDQIDEPKRSVATVECDCDMLKQQILKLKTENLKLKSANLKLANVNNAVERHLGTLLKILNLQIVELKSENLNLKSLSANLKLLVEVETQR